MAREFVPTTREQRDRLEAQLGGRRGSTRTRSDQDPRGMYGPREQTGTVTVNLGGDRGTREVATYGGPTQQGMPTGRTGFDSGSGERAGTLSQQEFMNVTGRTETNPYGNEGFFSRVFGIDPSKINYAANTPGGIATLNKVNALAYDQYLNPRDARGNIRGFLREGSPTRFGTVTYDPTLERDLGIMGALPLVGPLMQRANRRSALNISSYDNPLFSEMGDLGNELDAFPEGSVAAAPAAQAAQTGAISDVFTPFTTDPEERNFIEEDFEVDRRATDEDSPFSRPVPESTYRPIFTDDVTVADVIAAQPMVTTPSFVSENRVVQTREGQIPEYNPNLEAPAPAPRESILGSATDKLRGTVDEFEDAARRMEFFQDAYEELYPDPDSVLTVLPSTGDPIDLISRIPPRPMMMPTSKPSRGPTAADRAFAAQLEADLARRKARR